MDLGICLLLMIAVTYIPRALPLVLFRRPITSIWVKSFLEYVPYAVLAAMTIPAVFSSTRFWMSGVAGLLVAFILSMREKSLMVVSIGAVAAVWIVEMLAGLPF